MTADMDAVFAHLASQNQLPRLRRLWLAPFQLQDKFVAKIRETAAAARAGRGGRIVAKMNALTDERLIQALIDAGRAGVRIDLIVRGLCCLRPGIPGVSEHIRVRSIVGRFLEHSRVYHFENSGAREVYCASADWMDRNLYRRIEVAFPVESPEFQTRVIDDLNLYLADDSQAWELAADGGYSRAERSGNVSAQARLLSLYDERVALIEP